MSHNHKSYNVEDMFFKLAADFLFSCELKANKVSQIQSKGLAGAAAKHLIL